MQANAAKADGQRANLFKGFKRLKPGKRQA